MTDDEILEAILKFRPSLEEDIRAGQGRMSLLNPDDRVRLDAIIREFLACYWPKKRKRRQKRKKQLRHEERFPFFINAISDFLRDVNDCDSEEIRSSGTAKYLADRCNRALQWWRSSGVPAERPKLFEQTEDLQRAELLLGTFWVLDVIYRQRHPDQN